MRTLASRRLRLSGVVSLAIILTGVVLASQQAPSFRTQTTLMSVEVRVVDRRKGPITGLTAADFTVEEDGVPQKISHFVPINLVPETPSDEGVVRVGSRPADRPSTRRIFLIVLGRGELQIPTAGVDGMIHLVRNLLLPQDEVAVMAWNRATTFTRDRESILQVLERFKAGHKKVEALMCQQFSGLAAVYGSRDIPKAIQKEIDAVVKGTALDRAAPTLGSSDGVPQIESRVSRNVDVLMGSPTFDVFRPGEAEQLGMSLDDYVSNAVTTLQDLNQIYAAIGYLRHVDGEKHLVYVSPSGLSLPTSDDDKSVARVAEDARVVIDIFHTAGVRYPGSSCSTGGGGGWAVSSSQNIAEFTGGQFTGNTYGAKFMDKVDATTRTGYQIGYYSTNPAVDGKYRRINIKVNRRGINVFYRHGYYARADLATLDRRQVMTQSRIGAALRFGDTVKDLVVAGSARRAKTAEGKLEIVLQLNVAPAGIALTEFFMERRASLDVAVFCVDRGRYLVGQMWRTVAVQIDEKLYPEFVEKGIGFTAHVPIRRSAYQCKAVVYDYSADRVGTFVPRIR